MTKDQAYQQALDQLYQESGAPQFFNALLWIALLLFIAFIVRRIYMANSAKRKLAQDVLTELKKLNAQKR